MSPTYIWLIMAIVLFIAEIITSGFVVACFGVGALLSCLTAALGGGIIWQVILFAAGSIASLFFLKPFLSKISRKREEYRTGIEALWGKDARVTQRIAGHSVKGYIAIDGDKWPAFAQDPEASFEEGDMVRIVRNDSILMYVEAPREASPKINPEASNTL